MRSARPRAPIAFAVVAVSGTLTLGALSGCATTQETAAAKRAESKRILQARERRREKTPDQRQNGGRQ